LPAFPRSCAPLLLSSRVTKKPSLDAAARLSAETFRTALGATGKISKVSVSMSNQRGIAKSVELLSSRPCFELLKG